jgi:hypothetical protein
MTPPGVHPLATPPARTLSDSVPVLFLSTIDYKKPCAGCQYGFFEAKISAVQNSLRMDPRTIWN